MSITQEKLAEFIEDRTAYVLGKTTYGNGKRTGSSGVFDPKNSKYLEAIDKGLEKFTKIDPKDRPRGEGEFEETSPGGMQFVDDKGVLHKAFGPSEKLTPTIPEGLREDSFGRILRANILGNREGLTYEEKALSEGVGSAGGFLISPIVAGQVYDLARNQSCIFKAGALTFVMDGPEIKLVKIIGDPTAHFVAENEAIDESEWQIAPIFLRAITCGVVIRTSLELVEDAPNAAASLQNAMGAAIALKMDLSGLSGDGVNAPRGIANCSGRNIVDMGTNGGALTDYSKFSLGCEAVANANGIATSVIMAPRSFYVLDRLLEGTTNAPLPAPESYKNLQKFITNQVGITDIKGTSSIASKAYIGDFKQVLVGIRKSLEIETTRSGGTDTFTKCQLRIRARMRFDIAIMRENFFSVIEGIKPA